jgi:hypothetical protein
MATKTAEKLARALLEAKTDHERAEKIALLSGLVFWAATLLLAVIGLRDVKTIFANPLGSKLLVIWIIPTLVYITYSRKARDARQRFQEVKAIAMKKLNTDLCQHKNTCTCHQDFLEDMERQGIDLYF